MVLFEGQQASYSSILYPDMGMQRHYMYIEARVVNPVPGAKLVYRFTNDHSGYFKNMAGKVELERVDVGVGSGVKDTWRVQDDNPCIDRANSRLNLRPLDDIPDIDAKSLGTLWGNLEYNCVNVELRIEYRADGGTGKELCESQAVFFYIIRPKNRNLTLTVTDPKDASRVNGKPYKDANNDKYYKRQTVVFDFESRPGFRPKVHVKSGKMGKVETDATGNKLYYTYQIMESSEVEIQWEKVRDDIPLTIEDPRDKSSVEGKPQTGAVCYEGGILKVKVDAPDGQYIITAEGAEQVLDRATGKPVPNTFRVKDGAQKVHLVVKWDLKKKWTLTIVDPNNATSVSGETATYRQSQTSPVFYYGEQFTVDVAPVNGYEVESIIVTPSAHVSKNGKDTYSATENVRVEVKWRKVVFRTLLVEDDFSAVPGITEEEKDKLKEKWKVKNKGSLATDAKQYKTGDEVELELANTGVDDTKWKRKVVIVSGLEKKDPSKEVLYF